MGPEKGKRNEPLAVTHGLAVIADIKGLPLEGESFAFELLFYAIFHYIYLS